MIGEFRIGWCGEFCLALDVAFIEPMPPVFLTTKRLSISYWAPYLLDYWKGDWLFNAFRGVSTSFPFFIIAFCYAEFLSKIDL